MDKSLKEVNKQEVKRLIAIALLCTQTSAMQRPTMSSVLAMLLGDVEVAIIPSKPTYLVEWPVDGSSFVTNSTSNYSKNSYPTTHGFNSPADDVPLSLN